MNILYIPFTFDESLFDLEAKARKWREDYESKKKEVIVIYHGNAEIVQNEKIQQALRDGICKIYILSHGINTAELTVSNQSQYNEEYKEMPIEEVAAHFKSDLVMEGFNTNNIIKLYFCDEYIKDNKPRQMAEQFRLQLGVLLQSIEIKYYTEVSVSIPTTGLDSFFGKKGKGAVRNFKIENDFFAFNLSCFVGRARSFRQGLNVVENSADHLFIRGTPQVISYPKFSHPILMQLAGELVKMIQNDKCFARNQVEIIDELFRSLPLNISDYLVDRLAITGKKIKFEMKINRPLLNEYLIKAGVIVDKTITPTELFSINTSSLSYHTVRSNLSVFKVVRAVREPKEIERLDALISRR